MSSDVIMGPACGKSFHSSSFEFIPCKLIDMKGICLCNNTTETDLMNTVYLLQIVLMK